MVQPIDQASGQRGTEEEKPKNTTKKKKKTGRAGNRFLECLVLGCLVWSAAFEYTLRIQV